MPDERYVIDVLFFVLFFRLHGVLINAAFLRRPRFAIFWSGLSFARLIAGPFVPALTKSRRSAFYPTDTQNADPPFQWKTHTGPLKSAEDFDVRVLQSVKCISIEQRLRQLLNEAYVYTLPITHSLIAVFSGTFYSFRRAQSSIVRAAYSLIPPRPSWISAITSTSSREIRLRALILWRYIVYNHIELVVICHSKIVCRWQMMGRGRIINILYYWKQTNMAIYFNTNRGNWIRALF